MEASQFTETDTLNRIRQLESEISHNILIARRRAEKDISESVLQAEILIQKAVEEGHRNGHKESLILIKEAKGKADFLITKAREEAVRLSEPSEDTLNTLVNLAVNFLTGKQVGKVNP